MKRSFPKGRCAAAACLLLAGLYGNAPQAAAQLTLSASPYVQNFDNIALGLPEGWQVDTGATATSAGYNVAASGAYFINTPGTTTGWSNNSGAFKNMASISGFPVFAGNTSAIQAGAANRALGLRQVAATDARVAFMLEIANTAGLHSFNLQFRLQSPDSNASRSATWRVDYATGASPAAFTPVAALGNLVTGGNTYLSNLVQANFGNILDNLSGPVYIRIVSLANTSGSGSRPASAIDDFVLTWLGTPPPTHIQLTGRTPQGANVPLAVSQLTLHYDHAIAAGSGQVDLYKSGQPGPVMSFPVPGPGVSVTDSTVTLGSFSPENHTSYYVLMNEGAFRSVSDALPNTAITDTAAWTFTTVDTTGAGPLPLPFTTLEETFADCNAIAAGDFIAWSAAGNERWHCSEEGHGDNHAVSINGGISPDLSEVNEDWLVSKAPFDLSAMMFPQLSLWLKRQATGDALHFIRVSTDHVSGNNPATAHWTTIYSGNEASLGDNQWTQLSNIDLADYSGTPFYLALVYQCGSEGAYALSCDDLSISERVVQHIPLNDPELPSVTVLGDATPAQIRLRIVTRRATEFTMALYDLYGRKVFGKRTGSLSGTSNLSLNDTGLPAGMYILHVQGGGRTMRIRLPLQ